MNKIVCIAIAAIAAFTFTGCVVKEKTVEVPVQAETKVSPPATTKTDEQIFLEAVRSRGFGGTDQELITLGKDVCDVIGTFNSLEEFVYYAVLDPNFAEDPETMGFFVGASIGTFCPEYEAEVNQL